VDDGRSSRWAAERQHSVEGGKPTLDTAQSRASSGVGASSTVVGDADRQSSLRMPDVDPCLPGLGVLGDIGQQLRDGKVGGRFNGRGKASDGLRGYLDTGHRIEGQRSDGVHQAPVGENWRVDAAYEGA
jgi:hypothetical protein